MFLFFPRATRGAVRLYAYFPAWPRSSKRDRSSELALRLLGGTVDDAVADFWLST
jgi:hypothetical protein